MISIAEYDSLVDAEWDEFVNQTSIGNFLHTRKFLSYHGGRFNDKSLCVRDTKGRLMAVFGAAEDPDDNSCIVCHPGATYGGLVLGRKCKGELCVDTLQAIAKCYADSGYKKLVYKAVPFIYHKMPMQDDIYALFRLNAKHIQSDLSACIDLINRGGVSGRRKRALKKALKSGVKIQRGSEFIEPLWAILSENLQRKYNALPVHRLDEIKALYEMFPDEIDFVVATLEGEVISGVVLFYSVNVVHTQYIASSEKGYQSSGLDAVINYCIEKCITSGKRYFDFGTSNENSGTYLNAGLYEFKSEFGSGSVVYERYELKLGSE